MRVLLHTFGCKANQYDTQVVRQRLERAGCSIVSEPGLADAAVVNSCTVTHAAEAKLRGYVRRLARLKPGVRTVVMGCAAALDEGAIASLPSVAAVVKGSDQTAVAQALGLSAPDASPLDRFPGSSRAWLKIQDGCDERCTFCATTLARGASRSRDPEDIVREAALLARSHAEIVLTGVHIGGYGADLPARTTLGQLTELLIERVSTVRFRLSSLEATELDERLERLMAAEPQRLAPHLHAPLQSGSDRLLRRMGRRWYTAESYRRRIERLAERVQPLGLGADVIVGFPGETESDHRATVALVEALPFSYLHVFPWSARTGTAAARLSGAPGSAVVRERCEELRSLASRKREAHRLARAGGRADLVLEARSGGWRQGLSEDYLSVNVPADAPWAMGCARTSVRLALTAGRLTGAAA